MGQATLTPPRRIAATTALIDGASQAASVEPTLFDNGEQTQPADSAVEPAVSDPNGDNGTQAEQPRKKRGAGTKVDRNANIKPEGDVDFVPSGKQSLRDFFEEKTPRSDIEQILVICYFLQHILESSQIGPGHIFSGFRHVGVPVPKDLKQTIRNMKKQALVNFDKIDDVRLSTEGGNRVLHSLGNGNGNTGAS